MSFERSSAQDSIEKSPVMVSDDSELLSELTINYFGRPQELRSYQTLTITFDELPARTTSPRTFTFVQVVHQRGFRWSNL